MELFAWGKGFGLPSFDPFCLSIEALLNLVQVKWVVIEANSNASPTGELPVLKIQTEPIAGTSNIIKVLKQRGHDLDHTLSKLELYESQALICMIEDKLHDALLYTWYLENENYLKSTHPTMSDQLSFLTRYMLPNQIKEQVMIRLQKYRMIKKGDHFENQVYQVAREYYQVLTLKLGDKPYFYGSSPTTLDAVAFGHLALHCYPSLAVPKLFSILTFEFPQLIAYCERMKANVFSAPLKLSPLNRPSLKELVTDFVSNPEAYVGWIWQGFQCKKITEKTKEERIESFWRGVSVICSFAFFVGFVVKQNLIRIEIVDEEIND